MREIRLLVATALSLMLDREQAKDVAYRLVLECLAVRCFILRWCRVGCRDGLLTLLSLFGLLCAEEVVIVKVFGAFCHTRTAEFLVRIFLLNE